MKPFKNSRFSLLNEYSDGTFEHIFRAIEELDLGDKFYIYKHFYDGECDFDKKRATFMYWNKHINSVICEIYQLPNGDFRYFVSVIERRVYSTLSEVELSNLDEFLQTFKDNLI